MCSQHVSSVACKIMSVLQSLLLHVLRSYSCFVLHMIVEVCGLEAVLKYVTELPHVMTSPARSYFVRDRFFSEVPKSRSLG